MDLRPGHYKTSLMFEIKRPRDWIAWNASDVYTGLAVKNLLGPGRGDRPNCPTASACAQYSALLDMDRQQRGPQGALYVSLPITTAERRRASRTANDSWLLSLSNFSNRGPLPFKLRCRPHTAKTATKQSSPDVYNLCSTAASPILRYLCVDRSRTRNGRLCWLSLFLIVAGRSPMAWSHRC